jgi:hypothetical protein
MLPGRTGWCRRFVCPPSSIVESASRCGLDQPDPMIGALQPACRREGAVSAAEHRDEAVAGRDDLPVLDDAGEDLQVSD